MKNKTVILGKNRVILALVGVYLIIILGISYLASCFAYEQREMELLSELDMKLVEAAAEYKSVTENFWSVYIPVFENGSTGQMILRTYFASETDELTPLEKLDLTAVLSQMATRDSRVQWIALYNGIRSQNYIYYAGQRTLQKLDGDFAYLQDLRKKKDVMEIYGWKHFASPYGEYDSIAIAGGVPDGVEDSAILVGYDISTLQQICGSNETFSTLQFDVTAGSQSIYSSGETPYILPTVPESGSNGIFVSDQGRRYVQVSDQTANTAEIYYSLDWMELFRRSHRYTPMLLLIVAALVVFSFMIYGIILRMITQEVGIIRNGLEELGKNNLDYRIQSKFKQGGFQEIAAAVNAMAQNLKENIERAYEYELKQKDAEMQELQAKFNPHFLYNSLEMFRARCYQNGDEETAELIAQTAAIFRGFIGSRTFIPLREELAFSKRYLALFRARYGEIVEVLYDIDTEVLEYGIVRNVFQPLIENYFVHGIDTTRADNYICFHGKIRDEETILITVEDNGPGMDLQKMEELNRSLQEPIATEKESYGLKNLHQRLRLFYGKPCGLTLRPRPDGGICIEMIIGRVSYDYETEKPKI